MTATPPLPPPPEQPQLVMRLPDLGGLPPIELPSDYHVTACRDGCDAAWERIIGESFGWAERAGRFAAVMRSDPAFRPERVLFIARGHEPVATASAWDVPRYPGVGYLHYVGVLPGETGKRFGLQVSLAALHRMRDEGRTSAVLQTDDFRLPAVRTYLRLGFRPLLVHENQRARWRAVLEAIGRDTADFERELGAPIAVPAGR